MFDLINIIGAVILALFAGVVYIIFIFFLLISLPFKVIFQMLSGIKKAPEGA